MRARRHSVKYDAATMSSHPPSVIVIFGAAVRPDGQPSATLRERVDAAARFGVGDGLFIPTGAQGRFGGSEASVMRARLIDLGITPDRIILEETGTDTLSSVRAVRRLLVTHRLTGPVYVATSAYHQPRCLILCWIAGMRARQCPPPPIAASRRFTQRWFWRLREVPALPYDVILAIGLRIAGRF